MPIKATGYCPCWRCCGAFANGHTAINRDVMKYPFGIAVEPKLLPYRIELDVPGYGRAMVDDTGGASRSRNTPYVGRTLTGRVRHTVIDGQPVVIDGEAQR